MHFIVHQVCTADASEAEWANRNAPQRASVGRGFYDKAAAFARVVSLALRVGLARFSFLSPERRPLAGAAITPFPFC
jgi:hypothetical protein